MKENMQKSNDKMRRYPNFFKWLCQEKKLPISLAAFFCVSVWLMGYVFKTPLEYQYALLFLICFLLLLEFLTEYVIRKVFYQDFLSKLDSIDKKYLITEMLSEPTFLDGKILNESLYVINKTMVEHIAEVELAGKEWREYVEQWIHEIKLPISALELMNYNAIDFMQKEERARQMRQIQKLQALTEKILFFSRADAPWKDYLIKKVKLEKIINKALLNQKESLIQNKIRIEKEGLDVMLFTDAKWFEFIIGQIINNSVKYMNTENKITGVIRFQALEREETVQLTVEDNGIGIAKADLPRVFEKTFTGENGRKDRRSTGMGLYISEKMCKKLGHRISIESEQGAYTRVIFEFGRNRYYQM